MPKARISMVFGEHYSRLVEEVIGAYYEAEEDGKNPLVGGAKALQKMVDGDCLTIDSREFDTEAEVNAYLLGISDMEGWMDWYQLDNDQAELLQKIIDKRKEMEEV